MVEGPAWVTSSALYILCTQNALLLPRPHLQLYEFELKHVCDHVSHLEKALGEDLQPAVDPQLLAAQPLWFTLDLVQTLRASPQPSGL